MQSPPEIPSPTPDPLPENYTDSREQLLARLLPKYDLEWAKESGLLDTFYYDPVTGFDSLAHILVGDAKEGAHSSGFHHEPSGALLGTSQVDREHLANAPLQKRRKYEEPPFEPYAARVVINGYEKYFLNKNADSEEDKLKPARNAMYPKEYDPFMVLRAIQIAHNTRDDSRDKEEESKQFGKVFRADSEVPLIDGRTPMRIRMILDPDKRQVITAWPVVPNKPAVMSLSPEGARKHIFGE